MDRIKNVAGVGRAWLWGIVALLALMVSPSLTFAQQKFTEWGWPVPYEQVSPKSIEWLKSQGWWPLKIAYQAQWSGQNTINIVMDQQVLLKHRGLETK